MKKIELTYHDLKENPNDTPKIIQEWGILKKSDVDYWKGKSSKMEKIFQKKYEEHKTDYGTSDIVLAFYEDGTSFQESYHKQEGDHYFWSYLAGREHGKVIGWTNMPTNNDLKED